MDPDARTPARLFPGAVVVLGTAGFALLVLAVRHSGTPTTWERPILSLVTRTPFPFRDFLSSLFEPIPFALTTTALAFVAAARGRRHLVVPGLGGCLAAVIATQLVLKPLIDRVRRPVGLHHHLSQLGGPMFPSSHVTAAAAWATFAWLILDERSRLKPLLVALPLLVGVAVMGKDMHYPADVIGGLIVGPTMVYCTVGAVRATNRWVESGQRRNVVNV